MDRAQHGRSTSVVGRARELRLLDDALDATRDARGAAFFLTGEAGIGKTRLAHEAAGHAGELGMHVLRGRGSTIGPMVPFRPLTEVLMAVARSGALPDDEQLGSYRAVLGGLVPDWWTPGSAPGETSIVVLAEAVLRLLAAIGRDSGCLLVLDDLHDSDTESLAVVDYLADNLADVPAVVLATVRDEPGEALTMARAADHRGSATLVELGRLDRDELAVLAADCLAVDAAELPAELADELWKRTAGVPYVVEEYLHLIIGSGLLQNGASGWRLTGELAAAAPESLLRTVSSRMDRLGDEGRSVLAIAAVLGGRFPLAVVQQVAELDDRQFLSYLRMAARLQLVVPDETAADWYAFRHPLTVEALLGQLTPARLADISGRAADAVEALHPDLAGEWCQQVAALRVAAGDRSSAGRLFAEAGRRALADGAPGSAVALLERADALLTDGDDRAVRLTMLGSLVPALAEVGRLDDALRIVAITETAPSDATRLGELHTLLAKAACTAGRWREAVAQIESARALLGPTAAAEQVAAVDVVAAVAALGSSDLTVGDPEELARKAIAVAEAIPRPVIAFDGWQALGLAARRRDLDEAADCYRRALHLAERYRLPTQRVYTLIRLANIEWLAHGDVTRLHQAHQDADRLGLVVLSLTVQANLAMHALLCAEFDRVEKLVAHCLPTAARLKLDVIHRHLLVTRAAAYGHQGQRVQLDECLAELVATGPAESAEASLAAGLASGFCALAEGDVERARRELAVSAAYERANSGGYQLSGTHGLGVLLDTVATDGPPRSRTPEDEVAENLRWNKHFVELSDAVTYGRLGSVERASAAFERSQETGRPFPMALHMGRWLVAESAIGDGWADGVALLRSAEHYFHSTGSAGLVGASRAQLRSAGATMLQRRDGIERVPAALRTLGVTVREYEVLELLMERISNKEIGTRLHISHRTVEKHIANLITKTHMPDRFTLCTRAAQLLADG